MHCVAIASYYDGNSAYYAYNAGTSHKNKCPQRPVGPRSTFSRKKSVEIFCEPTHSTNGRSFCLVEFNFNPLFRSFVGVILVDSATVTSDWGVRIRLPPPHSSTLVRISDWDDSRLQKLHSSLFSGSQFPSDNHWGLHTMPITVCSKAAEIYQNFFTQDNK
jgi:hypothetical protein